MLRGPQPCCGSEAMLRELHACGSEQILRVRNNSAGPKTMMRVPGPFEGSSACSFLENLEQVTIIPAFADKSEGPHTQKTQNFDQNFDQHFGPTNVQQLEHVSKTKFGQNRPQVGAMKKRFEESDQREKLR